MLMTSKVVQDFCSQISLELMQGLAEIAVKEHRAGRCIPHAQVEESIMESMGWKFYFGKHSKDLQEASCAQMSEVCR